MKNALIDPTVLVSHFESWGATKPVHAVTTVYPNSARVCEVSDTVFDIGLPLFWVACADNVVADQFYFDTQTQEILPVVNAAYGTEGTQTF